VKQLAANRKPPPTRKAEQVTLQDLKDIVMRVVIPHRDPPYTVQVSDQASHHILNVLLIIRLSAIKGKTH